jgi:hypothetical protein
MDLDKDLRARILGAPDRVAPIPTLIPEWGETVYVRRLTLADRLTFEAEHGELADHDRKQKPREYAKWLVTYVIATACDANGTPIFSADDEAALDAKSGSAIERVAIVALKANTVTAEDVAALGKISGEARNGASPSGLPATSS